MSTQELLHRFHTVASDPKDQLKQYLAAGEKVVLTAPVYTPEEIIHAMGLGDFAIPTYAGQLLMLAVSIVLIAVGVVLYIER